MRVSMKRRGWSWRLAHLPVSRGALNWLAPEPLAYARPNVRLSVTSAWFAEWYMKYMESLCFINSSRKSAMHGIYTAIPPYCSIVNKFSTPGLVRSSKQSKVR
ncbi:hypothetical protein M430DRAFT_197897 [Amorphotheca resinae ATCC 22711]|uniref:Uncharacterized protein n=1 Tax=Amorphotheca resinae ATCC 22711 TaxID=857342 RepID=A0A2T3B9U9_AMORE|nr:hypothetical protein M430DRAFT_197897 [Amorphotheca resinae ATCC 22711]PSS25059.1 hypothetical protein M430DRAFT_197897 [Amorphotheca resinae ATCC 22711]